MMVNGAQNSADKQGMQPVHELCDGPALPHNELMVLLKTGADINATDGRGRTPLMLYVTAASKALAYRIDIGYPEQIEKFRRRADGDMLFLIQCGADTSLRDANGLTAYEMLPPRVLEELKNTDALPALRGGGTSAI